MCVLSYYYVLNERYYIYSSPQCIDAFVDELRWEEQDSTKRDKIRELKLTSEEWVRVGTFLDLLSVCLLFLLQLWYQILTIFISMLITPNKHFHPTTFRLFT
jgi:hypothetical protein